MRQKKDTYGATGCYCAVKYDDWNRKHIPESEYGIAYSLLNTCKSNGKLETEIHFIDGRVEKGSDYNLSIGYSSMLDGATYSGSNLVPINAIYKEYFTSSIKLEDIDYLTLNFAMPNQATTDQFTFKVSGVHHDSVYNRGHLDIYGVIDTVEVIYGGYNDRSCDIENSRDIILYLHKDYTDPIDEINWDPSINAFSYIIQQQFYEVTPNPCAATTLYTDFNITSSKVITADNITTMRSDLNIVTNNLDVVSYDVKDIKNKVEVTQHLQKDVKTNKIIASVALAFGVIGTVASIGMQLASNGITFAAKAGTQSMLKSCAAEGMATEMAVEETTSILTRSITTDISPILDWCNEDYKPITNIPFEEEYVDPKSKATSFYTSVDIANRFRDSLKPAFKMLANRINEYSDSVENVDFSDCVLKSELKRDDTIDIICKRSGRFIKLTAEDSITDGIISLKVFISHREGVDKSNDPYTFSITLENSQITEFKGADEYSKNNGEAEFPNISLNEKEIIIERADDSLDIAGAIVLSNSCIRRMNYSVNDLAYIQDIKALDDKIIALAEMSHQNDIQTLSIQEEFATINEVNTALENYVQIKDMPPVVDLKEYAKKEDIPAIISSNLKDIELEITYTHSAMAYFKISMPVISLNNDKIQTYGLRIVGYYIEDNAVFDEEFTYFGEENYMKRFNSKSNDKLSAMQNTGEFIICIHPDNPVNITDYEAIKVKVTSVTTKTPLEESDYSTDSVPAMKYLHENYALKSDIPEAVDLSGINAQIVEINSKLNNFISKDSLTNIFTKSLNSFVNDNSFEVDYPSEVKKYAINMSFNEFNFEFNFNKSEFPDLKYAVMKYSSDDIEFLKICFIIIYDFESKSGSITIFTR